MLNQLPTWLTRQKLPTPNVKAFELEKLKTLDNVPVDAGNACDR